MGRRDTLATAQQVDRDRRRHLGAGALGRFSLRGGRRRLVLVGLRDTECEQACAQVADSGGAVAYLVGDASQPATATASVAMAVERYGRLDGLYHVAGGSGRRAGDGPLDAVTDEGWQFTLRLNLDSLFYSNRAAVRQFLQQGGGGSVLNLGSVLARSPSPQFFATHSYATAKAAAIGLTQAAAAYYAPRVSASTCSPGAGRDAHGPAGIARRSDPAIHSDQAAAGRRTSWAAGRSGSGRNLLSVRRFSLRHRPGVGGRRRLVRQRGTSRMTFGRRRP